MTAQFRFGLETTRPTYAYLAARVNGTEKLAHNTTVTVTGMEAVIRYHDNVIARIRRNKNTQETFDAIHPRCGLAVCKPRRYRSGGKPAGRLRHLVH